MTSAGQAIAGVMARLDEAREVQAEQFAMDLFVSYGRANPGPAAAAFGHEHWHGARPAVQDHYRRIARGMMAQGYRKAAQ